MKRINRYLHILFLVACCHSMVHAQSRGKVRYVGDYQYNSPLDNSSDTLHAKAFFTKDSFLLVYMIRHDSDYRYPVFRGSWQLVNDTAAELRYNGIKRTISFDGETYIRFHINGAAFMKM